MTVYFMQEEDEGNVKIGTTEKHPSSRRAACQTGNPKKLEIIARVEAWGEFEEGRLHARFAAAHIRGEWFRPTKELMQFISAIKKEQIDEKQFYNTQGDIEWAITVDVRCFPRAGRFASRPQTVPVVKRPKNTDYPRD